MVDPISMKDLDNNKVSIFTNLPHLQTLTNVAILKLYLEIGQLLLFYGRDM